jgi:polyisoprenoid-binding protein YceI
MTTTTLPTLTAGRWTVLAERTTASFSARGALGMQVRGTIGVREGQVVVDEAGRPVAIHAVLDAATIATGNKRRDADLCGPRFLRVLDYPDLRWRARLIRPAEVGWRLEGALTVAGATAPMNLDVTVETGAAPASWRVHATGVLDLRGTPIRAPRLLVGPLVRVDINTELRTPEGRSVD